MLSVADVFSIKEGFDIVKVQLLLEQFIVQNPVAMLYECAAYKNGIDKAMLPNVLRVGQNQLIVYFFQRS